MIPEYTSYEDYTDDTYLFWPIGHGKLGDTYTPRVNEDLGHIHYYGQAYANAEDFQTAKDHPELTPFVKKGRSHSRIAWSHAHLYLMLEYARGYRAVLSKLEWILFGQRPMKFVEEAQGVVQPQSHR
ncbi:hypothetical protein FVEG_16457 [Fusarium verticillioides 7600]|uniref:Uncharacterized protein n=1 Tax=Gibberella moniliformis (strain M3125 / FGSC 7600) TaxID=334819 RepID=W7MCN9_GIBM7|nr:hypothetical protein FVEG_16457 [Fusarium verticillioides 7600]EWG49273.1 hypothetical protein FVEG_16457 [Fusarium verticillioides 7600]